ncbi:hypothetical protein PENTCL1PPCAC_12639, partial [Pristionchus entomophagus]
SSVLILIVSIAILLPTTAALNCPLCVTVSVTETVDFGFGNFGNRTSSRTIGDNSIACGVVLDRCGNFAKMNITDFLKLDAATLDNFKNQKFNGNEEIVGSTCMSQKDCASINAAASKSCPAGTSCCYTTEVSATTVKALLTTRSNQGQTTTSDTAIHSVSFLVGVAGLITVKMLL